MTSRRTARHVRGVVLLLLALVLSGCSSLRGTGDLQYVPGEGNIVEVPLAERGEPVELTGESLEGEPLDLADSRGEVTVVNVWWSGCTPCRTEMPMLAQAAREMDDVTFLGINTRNPDRGTAIAFERAQRVPYPSIYDVTGAPLLAFGQRYAPQAMPSTVVLDPEGRVAALVTGVIPTLQTLRDIVEAAGDG